MDTEANIPNRSQLLRQIEGFLADRKMAETTFGRLAVNDGKFVGRLRSGSNMTIDTIIKVVSFIEAERV
jgi:hypothetical protein